MSLGRVRSVEDRLEDRSWHRGERVGFWLTVLTAGCFTFAWFGVHALRQFHTDRRERDESWAALWGGVALVSWWFGAGLMFETTQQAGISVLVWALRLGSLFHVYLDHGARMTRLAEQEVAREREMISSVLEGQAAFGGLPASGGRSAAGGGRVAPRGGRFEVPAQDPFVLGRVEPPPPPPVRGRSWGRLGAGAPAADLGRRLESPAPPAQPEVLPADGLPDAPLWVPGLEPLEPGQAPRPGRDGRGDPAAPPSGRVLDL
ncbi:hypothetical protein [Sanguibacter sp. HDW7]|uniref:hypothetical protein n=1 Tax=Sanguibacter sp. HDW7 TaxID=2714931 RepID=UPI00140D3172|nr:hypothetical protein [Sanguibacter sp. HDW7]QIK84094.1 hypothetical protein G7063_11030 [Sanguibacter sp. HDW7]